MYCTSYYPKGDEDSAQVWSIRRHDERGCEDQRTNQDHRSTLELVAEEATQGSYNVPTLGSLRVKRHTIEKYRLQCQRGYKVLRLFLSKSNKHSICNGSKHGVKTKPQIMGSAKTIFSPSLSRGQYIYINNKCTKGEHLVSGVYYSY